MWLKVGCAVVVLLRFGAQPQCAWPCPRDCWLAVRARSDGGLTAAFVFRNMARCLWLHARWQFFAEDDRLCALEGRPHGLGLHCCVAAAAQGIEGCRLNLRFCVAAESARAYQRNTDICDCPLWNTFILSCLGVRTQTASTLFLCIIQT